MATDMHKPAEQNTDTTLEVVPDATTGEMQEIVLRVGPGGGRTQRFTGRLLTESHQVTTAGTEIIRIYLSRKGKFVVHRHYIDWNDLTQHAKKTFQDKKEGFAEARAQAGHSGQFSQADLAVFGNWLKDMKDWRGFLGLDENFGDFTLDIVDTLAEVRNLVPAKAYRIVADAVGNPSVEHLDI
ncbi:EXLDI protein [Nocardia huaxiensis]|uniref:EXLDI protein n=1 Tax=Nocardia huaxiensis TaxID=2755382 RepID=A0A7D6ZII9_9NOCA|nr:EXLDI protein [Nocardia huaxiensis]QLY31799.1 EXLDI protein [Nocardia huaxiensis]UFS95358.1 EXLDI protein [Nocardia huaxiensis]